jgi:hypothetical protein
MFTLRRNLNTSAKIFLYSESLGSRDIEDKEASDIEDKEASDLVKGEKAPYVP